MDGVNHNILPRKRGNVLCEENSSKDEKKSGKERGSKTKIGGSLGGKNLSCSIRGSGLGKWATTVREGSLGGRGRCCKEMVSTGELTLTIKDKVQRKIRRNNLKSPPNTKRGVKNCG